MGGDRLVCSCSVGSVCFITHLSVLSAWVKKKSFMYEYVLRKWIIFSEVNEIHEVCSLFVFIKLSERVVKERTRGRTSGERPGSKMAWLLQSIKDVLSV